MMTASELVRRCVDVAKNYKTLYVMGCFGAPMTPANKKRYTQNHSYNKASDRTRMINSATADTFGFDCVCLIKGILWGWNGDLSKQYGGAAYTSNGVQDVSADGMIKLCKGVTADFRGIVPGAAVWMTGHIGVYIGDGLVVECSPKWTNGVQITAVGNIGKKSGYNTRTWTKWGLIPYVDYKEEKDLTENEVRAVVRDEVSKIRDELARARAEQSKAPADKWALPHIETCIRAGVMSNVAKEGEAPMIDRPKDPPTRQEMAVVAAGILEKQR